MAISRADQRWLESAARLSLRGRPLSRPNPAVGAVIVRGSAVIGRGWTQAGGRPHAEAMALAQAGGDIADATVYVSLEPCAHGSERGPACADLLVAARPARVIIGVADPDPRTAGAGMARLRQAGIEAELADCAASRASLAGYLSQRQLGRPHVTLKLALSIDGAIATAQGESQWITGAAARWHVHSRRTLADAIVVGGATWRGDRPGLDVRLAGLEARSPERLVLSRGVVVGALALPNPRAIHDLPHIQYLYLEGGGGAAAAFLADDLVDRLEIYRAPIVIGGGRAGLGDIGLAALAEAHGRWTLAERRQLGSDSFTAYERTRTGSERVCSPG